MKKAKTLKEVGCQQILMQDGSVYSIQRMDLPQDHNRQVTTSFLLDRYYATIRRLTGSVIRPVASDAGVQFRLLGRLPLLSFSPPQQQLLPQGEAVHLLINGGFLVQPGECDRGRFSLLLESHHGSLRITVQLTGYCPLLLGSAAPSRFRKLLYRATQAYIHKVVTVRYLIALYRELTGEKPRAKVQKVRVRDGEEI